MSTVAQFLLRRGLQVVPVLFGVVTLVFILSRFLPGDAASVFLSPTTPPQVIAELRQQFGLDQPMPEQYVRWLKSVLHGDLGYSFSQSLPVADVLMSVFPNTVVLGLTAFVVEILLTVVITFLCVWKMGSKFDRLVSHALLATYALPSFWVGLILLTVFAYRLELLPPSQMFSSGMEQQSYAGSALDLVRHLVLPVLTIAIPGAAGLARFFRTSIDRVLAEDYVLAAEGMGLSKGRILLRIVFPNASGALVSLLGIEIGVLLTGVVVTESLFAWPGLGRLAVMALFTRDYPLVLGCTLVTGFVVVAGNLLADLGQTLLDPRIRERA